MSYLNCDSTTAAIGSGPAPPMTSLGKLPKLMGRVVPSQALGFYQLYKASGNATQRDDTKEVFYQATSWNAPRYMDRPVNPAMEPFHVSHPMPPLNGLSGLPQTRWNVFRPIPLSTQLIRSRNILYGLLGKHGQSIDLFKHKMLWLIGLKANCIRLGFDQKGFLEQILHGFSLETGLEK